MRPAGIVLLHFIEQPGHLFASGLRRGGVTRRFPAQHRRVPIRPIQIGHLQKGLQQGCVLLRGHDGPDGLLSIEFFGAQQMRRRSGGFSTKMERKA